MPAQSPEETSKLFTDGFDSANADALVSLYEPDAITLPPTGDPAINTSDARRELFGGMFTLNPKIALNVTGTLIRGDTALVTGSWTLEGKDPDGNPVNMDGHYADVVRRQADGTWLVNIDNPPRHGVF